MRVVNDNEIGAAALDAAAERHGIESAAGGGGKIHHRGMILRDPRLECVLEPFGLQNAADIASNALCEVFGIRHDHDLRRRLMGEFPSRKANGRLPISSTFSGNQKWRDLLDHFGRFPVSRPRANFGRKRL